jgi:hypothetical protein
MARCDLCSSKVPATELERLIDQYQVAGIADVCSSCRRWANKTLDGYRDEIGPKMREAIRARAGVTEQPPKRPGWLRRLWPF